MDERRKLASVANLNDEVITKSVENKGFPEIRVCLSIGLDSRIFCVL